MAAFVKESTEGLFHHEPVYLSEGCGVLSPHTWQLKPLNPDNLPSDERGGTRNKTLSCSTRIYWLANETKITCKNVALFESSLGFTWEIANYRQVLSGAKRLRHHSHTFCQAQAHSCIEFVQKMFAFSCCPSLWRIYRTVKPDSQECQAWTQARPTSPCKQIPFHIQTHLLAY